ncbi:MAG TPA: hypothetical protein VER37_08785, partial [Thermomicrobiales bacterium]|nr:hypothetical protein [Thermomicrobiales bacterium]
ATVVERWLRLSSAGAVRRYSPMTGLGRVFDARSMARAALPDAAERFASAIVPAGILVGTRTLLTTFSGPDRRIGPISTLASFAAPRQVLAARVATGGAEAELAAALAPVRIVLVGRVERVCVAVVTEDLVAAELVWVASLPPKPKAAVAWQRANVQKASMLGLGASSPADLVFSGTGLGGSASRTWLEVVVTRCGVERQVLPGWPASKATILSG